ncbi:MAG: SDR family oxidoreductase [Nevskia sp.]|nr:SDR family oxidoreductase [Nevskia sp.]
MKKILIVGATSAIAEAVARRFAARGERLYLIGRDAARLETMAADLKVRGAADARHGCLDLNEYGLHAMAVQQALTALGGLDAALIAHGTLGDQKACEADFTLALRELETNALSTISLLTHLANEFEHRGGGLIAVIGSVAGDRGRGSNYVYGTAKAAVETFTEGLRCRLFKSGVGVLLVKPGFVDTPMTQRFKKGPLWASPDRVAGSIVRAMDRRADVIYTPWFWRLIMGIIKAIPRPLFKRLKL